MSYPSTPPVIEDDIDEMVKDAGAFTESFHDAIASMPKSDTDVAMTKVASAEAGMIKRVLRESGVFRNALPIERVTTGMLTQHESHDLPRIIREMEAAQIAPRIVNLGDAPYNAPFRGDKYEIVFFEIQTPEFIANTTRLSTYKHDVRGVLTENFLRDIQTLEDTYALGEVDTVCGPSSGVGSAGMNQYQIINSAITMRAYPSNKEAFIRRQIPHGCNLIGALTTIPFETFDSDELGPEARNEMFRNGAKSLKDLEIGGVRHLVTIKNNLAPRGLVYQFTEPDFLGNFCILEDVQVYLSRKRDWIRTSATEKIAITFANTAGLNKVEFQG